MARISVCKKPYVFDQAGKAIGIHFQFTNGSEHKVMFEDFSDAMKEAAMAHGFAQSLGDSYSQSSGKPEIAEGMFLQRLESLKNGEWRSKGSGGGLADEDLAQALAIVTKRPIDEARARVAEEDKAWKDSRRKHPLVSAELAKITAARKSDKAKEANASTDGLL